MFTCQADSSTVADSDTVTDNMPTTTTTDTASDTERDSTLSALRLSELDMDPAVSSGSVAATSADNTDALSVAANVPATSKTSQLPRESDLSTSVDRRNQKTDNIQAERPPVVTDAVSALATDTDARNSQPSLIASEVCPRPASLVYQFSLPEQSSVSSREDKDMSAVVSIFFQFLKYCPIIISFGKCFACWL